jgi:uncharacterized protein YbaR (Trm112 family)
VNENICRDISKDTLIAYADGELPPDQAEQVKTHMVCCEDCKSMLSAVQRSLQVTQLIWKSDEAQWPRKRSFRKPLLSIWLAKRIAAVAASILLIVSVGVMRRLLYKPGEEMFPVRQEIPVLKIDEIEIQVHHAGLAAQMLAVADLLAAQPEGEQYAAKRYNYVINSFPQRDECEQAKLRLQNLLERTVKQ